VLALQIPNTFILYPSLKAYLAIAKSHPVKGKGKRAVGNRKAAQESVRPFHNPTLSKTKQGSTDLGRFFYEQATDPGRLARRAVFFEGAEQARRKIARWNGTLVPFILPCGAKCPYNKPKQTFHFPPCRQLYRKLIKDA
jgi:hypothetical protein